jgi:hypothetical protein
MSEDEAHCAVMFSFQYDSEAKRLLKQLGGTARRQGSDVIVSFPTATRLQAYRRWLEGLPPLYGPGSKP